MADMDNSNKEPLDQEKKEHVFDIGNKEWLYLGKKPCLSSVVPIFGLRDLNIWNQWVKWTLLQKSLNRAGKD